MSGKNPAKMKADPGVQMVVITRVFDAPRKLVYEAFTDPKHISQWWGPVRLENNVEKMEARMGGIWRVIQTSPEGNTYGFHGVYHEVAAPERIVRTFEFEGLPGHVALESVTLDDISGKTRMTNISVFQSVEDRDGMIKSGMESGMNESFERLDELLAKILNEK
jgi:uncharacterized protein YndB with AHSA1/START domain